MTSDEEILQKGVFDNPDDDTARLVYADAVQERGDAALADLIRRGVLCHCVTERYVGRPIGDLFADFHCSSCADLRWLRRCEHEGCREGGFGCFLPGWDSEGAETTTADGFYCGLHAPDYGYCARCGAFSAGIESFDFSRGGLCSDCQDDVESEDEEYEDDREFGYGGEYYPDEF